jgi:hypothetical protein
MQHCEVVVQEFRIWDCPEHRQVSRPQILQLENIDKKLHSRYGAGIYSYLNPALADGFSTSCTTSPYRVMIACDAIVPTVGKRKRAPGSVSDKPTQKERR